MSLKGIMSITGMGGLFKLVAQTKTGFVVESLTDKKRYPVSASQKISMLDDISVFTKGGDMPLKEVLLKIKEKETEAMALDPKGSAETLKIFFKSVVPDFDEEKVYASDIKKMVTWFQLIKDLVGVEEPVDAKTEEAEAALAASREPQQHLTADHQRVKVSDKKGASARTRKKV